MDNHSLIDSNQQRPKEAYTWDPLPDSKTWIRILNLECGEDNEPLLGSLDSAPISSDICYDATSYCVGPTETDHRILLRKQDELYSLPITSSLFDMLQRFRSPTETRRLWIDAICIHQTNLEEKGDQIMLMHKIYSLTQRVLIYLGEPDGTATAATNLMSRIYRAVQDTPTSLQLRPLDWQITHHIPLVNESWSWEPLKDFFCRPWFVRKWTIQECILPPKTIFHCGVWEAEWDFMDAVITAIYDKSLAVLDHTTYSKVEFRNQLQQGLNQFHSVANLRKTLSAGRRFQLMDIIYHFQTSRATDLRDHMFALLGLASDSNNPELRPDYKATILDTCLRYAQFFLKQKNNLEVLYRAGTHGQKLLAPSWIPNWYGKQLDFGFENAQGPWDPLRRPSFYNVGRGTSVSIEYVGDPAILRLKGVVIDKIKLLANKHLNIAPGQQHDKDLLLSQKRKHLEECDAIVSSLHNYPTLEPLDRVLWRTLICGVTLDIHRAPENPYAESYLGWRKCLRNEFSNRLEMESLQQRQQPFEKVIDGFNGDKIFGSTEAGYLGMFNKSTRTGDIIVAFYGGEFPCVLRPRQTSGMDKDRDFEFIGQCYVHGLMEEGEFDIKSSKYKAQWFHLGSEYEVEPPFQPGGRIPSESHSLPPYVNATEAPAFFLYLPPTPITGRFVMLEESTKTFYDVNTVMPLLGNPTSWATTGLSPSILSANRLAIIITNPLNQEQRADLLSKGPMQDGRSYDPNFEVARLVSVTQQNGDMVHAKILGKVTIHPFNSDVMNFDKLSIQKGPVLPDEMRNGLLGKLYGGLNLEAPFVHPEILEKMPRKWHVDAAVLNNELDRIFASGLEVKAGSVKWLLS